MRRFSVEDERGVYVRAYAIQHPNEDIGSPEVEKRINKDFEAFYSGEQHPDYVFDTYIGRFPDQIAAE